MYNTLYITYIIIRELYKMAITKEQIIQSAEELQAEGVNITMNAIRERLKGGSFATISPVLREWKQGQERTAQIALEMPLELNGAIQRAGAEIWSVASALASAKLEAVQIEAQGIVDEAQSERDEALKEIERLERDQEEVKTELESKTVDARELEARETEQTLIASESTAKATIEGLEARLQDAKEAMEKLAKMSETPKKQSQEPVKKKRTYKKKPEQSDIEDK